MRSLIFIARQAQQWRTIGPIDIGILSVCLFVSHPPVLYRNAFKHTCFSQIILVFPIAKFRRSHRTQRCWIQVWYINYVLFCRLGCHLYRVSQVFLLSWTPSWKTFTWWNLWLQRGRDLFTPPLGGVHSLLYEHTP